MGSLTESGIRMIPAFISDLSSKLGSLPAKSISSSGSAYLGFCMPEASTEIINAYLVGEPSMTKPAANVDLFAQYGNPLLGEAHNFHTESDIANTFNYVAGKMGIYSIMSVLTGVQPGDQVGIEYDQSGAGAFDLLQLVVFVR